MENTKKSQHQEGQVTKEIENQTAKLPSDVFLWAAISAMAVSLSFQLAGKKHSGLFFGQRALLSRHGLCGTYSFWGERSSFAGTLVS